MPRRTAALLVALAPLVGAACGASTQETGTRPTVVVTTPVLGDIVADLVGDQADVEVIMPGGAAPHDFAASAREAERMRSADVLVVNGQDLEEGLVPVIDAARAAGTDVYEATTGVDLLAIDGPADGAAGDDHGELDPHFFTDPARMAVATRGIAEHLLENLDGIDAEALGEQADEVVAGLEALDTEVESMLAGVPESQRTLVTDHEVLASFADRYGFALLGSIVPNPSPNAEPSAADLATLATAIEETGVPAVFVDASARQNVAEALADSLEGVDVVEVYAESLGPEGSGADTYAGMVRTNAERISAALG